MITVTGATGFVGQNLIKYLSKKNIKTLALSLRDQNWKSTLNINSEAIIHLAGKAHDTKNTSSAEDYYKINRDLTVQLYDEFLTSNVQDFFYFSSVKATADTIDGILDENHHSNPQTPYGKSKLAAENYLLAQQLPPNKRLFIIRPCMIHGPGNKGNLNLLYKVVKTGFPWPLAGFKNKRSFLSIDNLNYLIKEMILNKNFPSGIYNFADDKSLSTNEVVSIIAESIGKKTNLMKINNKLISKMARVGDLMSLPFNSERLKKLTESYEVSNYKIKKELQISALPVSAEEGLRKTIKSFL